MTSNISEEEVQQLLRTVEMFEAITESQTDDYQSLEILKEAYLKLGRNDDALRVSKSLAGVYVNLGQISQAILEYEGILQEYPNDANVRAALTDLETKTSKLGIQSVSGAPSLDEDSKPTPPAGAPAGAPIPSKPRAAPGDGDRALANMLIAEKLITPQAVDPLILRLKTERLTSVERGQPSSLLQLLADEQILKLDDVLGLLVDKCNTPYLPLSTYDVDRDVACLLPKDLCFQHCMIPFDLISRSVLIATVNPFDTTARNQVQAMLDYNAFWFVTSPAEIAQALRKVYGLESRSGVAQVKS